MFERFTDEARWVVVHAQEEARELRAPQIRPAHLLLALSRDPGRGGTTLRDSGVDAARLRSALARSEQAQDADALAAFGIDLDAVRSAAEAAFGPGALDSSRPMPTGHMPFADESKRVLEQTLRFVSRRKEKRIDSGHVLVGVLAVADPTVTRVLQQLGTDPDVLRARAAGSDAA
jgi:ATP-dependent Clp protease ATP-binding subunit ClpA